MSSILCELLPAFLTELRRGTSLLAVLTLLRTPRYGYSLVETLADRGIAVDANTLYPLLRRLEKQGLLTSVWETSGPKPRKYYVVTELGDGLRAELARHWNELSASIDALIEEAET